jgi:hypothetical protein
MAQVRLDGRLTKVPHQAGIPVDTWWDIGRNDYTAIWFTQTVGREAHLIDYYENHLYSFSHYANLLQEKREKFHYQYGKHTGPHDLGVTEFMGPGTTRQETALGYGIRFVIAPRAPNKVDDIEAARNFLSICVFDKEMCSTGIDRLDNYRWKWDAVRAQWMDEPLKDGNDHGSDAFQVLAKMHPSHIMRSSHVVKVQKAPPKGAWT